MRGTLPVPAFFQNVDVDHQQLALRGDLHLGEDVSVVGLDRIGADTQGRGDLRGGAAPNVEVEHVVFCL